VIRRRRGTSDPRPLEPEGQVLRTLRERRAALERVRERIERQGAAQRRRTRLRRATPLVALAAFAAGFAAAEPLLRVGIAARPELFAVRRLAVIGALRLAPLEVARAASLGAERFGGGTPEAVASGLLFHPWIARARVARVSPDTVVVRIAERVPAAVWVRGGAAPLLVDTAGTPFAPASGVEALPRLRLNSAAPPCLAAAAATPCVPDPRLVAGLELARAVEEGGFPTPEVELEGPDPHAVPALRLPGVAPRVLIGAGDVAGKLERLARALAEVPESRASREIDLRFAGHVVLRPAGAAPEGSSEPAGAAGSGAAESGGGAGAPAAPGAEAPATGAAG
jgi:hypothetical protein